MVKKSLLLIWRDPDTFLYFHVGTLTYDKQNYVFEYTHYTDSERRVRDAIAHGYTLHPAFPNLEEKYVSKELFLAFSRRIPSKNRVDYHKVLDTFGLPIEADKMDVLRATRGALGNDPYFFAEPLRLVENQKLLNHFYISGMRHVNLNKNWHKSLSVGDELILEVDEHNKHDKNAVKILSKSQHHLGYVPGIFAKAIRALLDRNVYMKVVVQEVNPTYSPRWWVQVDFKSVLNKKFTEEPFEELDGLVVSAA